MCSLFGLIDHKNSLPAFARRSILRILSQECEIRGTDATGIAYVSNDGLHVFKRPVCASKFRFTLPKESKMVIGHTRMTTKGSQDINCNNHPFYGKTADGRFALAHNGVLYNDEKLRKSMKLPVTSIETDSYIAVQLLEHYGKVCFESIAQMAEKVSGSFCFSILTDRNELYLVKGSNPLVIYDCGGFYVYASTADILNKALKRLHIHKKGSIDIKSGEIMKISADGSIERGSFNDDADDYPYYPYWGRYDAFGDYDTELDNLIRCAGYFGFDESDIMMLIELGYDELEIEEMLYDPFTMREIISEYKEIMV